MGQVRLGNWWRALGLTTALLVGTAACSGSGSSADPTTTTTAAPNTTEAPASSSTTSPPMTDEEAVLAAYQAYWDTWLAANDPPNPDHPDLAKVATGAAYENARHEIFENAVLGHSLRAAVPSLRATQVISLQVDGDVALLSSCEIDDGLVVETSTGEVLNDLVGSSLVESTISRVDGAWKVERTDFITTLEGGNGCAS